MLNTLLNTQHIADVHTVVLLFISLSIPFSLHDVVILFFVSPRILSLVIVVINHVSPAAVVFSFASL